jgi:hypothetical protein
MSEAVTITALEIIGYANRLTDTMLPAVVPPVFRVKDDSDRILLPPYFLRDGLVCDATEKSAAELLALEEKEEVTRFAHAIAAKLDHELWVNLEGVEIYEPIPSAAAKLQKIAADHIEIAMQALRRGEFEEAESACRVAISADDRLMDALAISAASAAHKNDKGSEKLMRKLAMGRLTAVGFEYLVTGYKRLVEVPLPIRDLLAIHPMRGMAALKPEPEPQPV